MINAAQVAGGLGEAARSDDGTDPTNDRHTAKESTHEATCVVPPSSTLSPPLTPSSTQRPYRTWVRDGLTLLNGR